MVSELFWGQKSNRELIRSDQPGCLGVHSAYKTSLLLVRYLNFFFYDLFLFFNCQDLSSCFNLCATCCNSNQYLPSFQHCIRLLYARAKSNSYASKVPFPGIGLTTLRPLAESMQEKLIASVTLCKESMALKDGH